jgi:hypothetical protein
LNNIRHDAAFAIRPPTAARRPESRAGPVATERIMATIPDAGLGQPIIIGHVDQPYDTDAASNLLQSWFWANAASWR